jgi:hypothetical protein
MTWTCPGCSEIYLEPECPACHMKGDAIAWPADITIEGVEYLVQRQLRGPTVVVRGDGGRMLPGERHLVLSAFLAQQHR